MDACRAKTWKIDSIVKRCKYSVSKSNELSNFSQAVTNFSLAVYASLPTRPGPGEQGLGPDKLIIPRNRWFKIFSRFLLV